jgi:NADH:ubiquinone oxidoreductase subunit 3 (subunit A)
MNTLTIFIIFTPIFVISLLLINFFVAISQPDTEKLSPYEYYYALNLLQRFRKILL